MGATKGFIVACFMILFSFSDGLAQDVYYSNTTVTKVRMVHLNEEKTKFVSGCITFAEIDISIRKIRYRKNRIKLSGTMISPQGQLIFGVEFYVVKDCGTFYEVVKKIGETDFDGEIKFSYRLKEGEYIFMNYPGYKVIEVLPNRELFDKIDYELDQNILEELNLETN